MMNMIKEAIRRGEERSRVRREMYELSQMDSRMLRDIGLTHSDVIAARRRLRYWM